MRYRAEPNGADGSTLAYYDVVDSMLSGLNTSICTTTFTNARKIVEALNSLEALRSGAQAAEKTES